MRFRTAKSVALASILSDFLRFFGINIHRSKYKQNVNYRQIVQFYATVW